MNDQSNARKPPRFEGNKAVGTLAGGTAYDITYSGQPPDIVDNAAAHTAGTAFKISVVGDPSDLKALLDSIGAEFESMDPETKAAFFTLLSEFRSAPQANKTKFMALLQGLASKLISGAAIEGIKLYLRAHGWLG